MYSTHKDGLQHVVRRNDGVAVALAVALKWARFFQSCESEVPPNLFQLIAFVLSVPGSNAFPERIFSLMNSKWTCDRNRMSVALVKAELQVFANYTYDCREFYAFAIDDRRLLDAAATNSKYHWKNK